MLLLQCKELPNRLLGGGVVLLLDVVFRLHQMQVGLDRWIQVSRRRPRQHDQQADRRGGRQKKP